MPLSQPHADAACNFFELVLKHTADEWYGKPFLLVPWQEEALTAIFGQIDTDGNRIIDMAYLEVPKKAGKSEMAAGLALRSSDHQHPRVPGLRRCGGDPAGAERLPRRM